MRVKIKDHGDVIGLNYDDEDLIIRVGTTFYTQGGEVVEVFEMLGLKGLLITNNRGAYHVDIDGSGTYDLIQVEDRMGNMLHDQNL